MPHRITSYNVCYTKLLREKGVSHRTAIAKGIIHLPASLDYEIETKDIITRKGSVIHTAIIAGTLAAKRTSDTIPFCHPLPIEAIEFSHQFLMGRTLEMRCEVRATHKTGVEMEALNGVTAALLTVYDMCKSAGQDMEISCIEVVRKTGGKSDINKLQKDETIQ